MFLAEVDGIKQPFIASQFILAVMLLPFCAAHKLNYSDVLHQVVLRFYDGLSENQRKRHRLLF